MVFKLVIFSHNPSNGLRELTWLLCAGSLEHPKPLGKITVNFVRDNGEPELRLSHWVRKESWT